MSRSVLNAQTTITITSTLTITSYPVTILTITTTASLIPPTSSSPPQSSSSEALALPTPAIAGIATGGSILAVILGALVVLSIRRRRRRHHTPPPSYLTDNYYDPHHDGHNRSNLDIHMREPTLPPLPAHFAPAVPAAHHAATYHLPMSYTGRRGLGHHRRDTTTTTITTTTTTTSSTGQTTLVGSGMPGAGPVLGPKKEGEEGDDYSYPGVAEVQGSEPTRGGGRVELEGSSPPPSSSPRYGSVDFGSGQSIATITAQAHERVGELEGAGMTAATSSAGLSRESFGVRRG